MKTPRTLILLGLIFLASTLSASAAVVEATFKKATDVPVTAASYTATGTSVNFTLSYAPVVGTELMVVKNTHVGSINDVFSNLPQGQTVILSYGGINYNFVANYYGGTGNDLVLDWKNNRLVAWGSNNDGELGNYDGNSAVPVAVIATSAVSGKTVLAVSAGNSHSVALCSDGTVAAWGENEFGQLGNNSTTDSSVPVVVTLTGALSSKTVVTVSAGGNHSLALCSDGAVISWGDNQTGQLGNNSYEHSAVPVT